MSHGFEKVEIRRHEPGRPWTYSMLDLRQREIAAEVRKGGPSALLLSEVAPVITRGRRTDPRDLVVPAPVIAQAGIELTEVSRGGLATYHGPGQWVLFAIDRLEALTGDRSGVRKAVNAHLLTALEVGRIYDPTAEIKLGAELGVWGKRGKFAAVGIQIDQGVLLHGLSINAFRTSQSFFGLKPCGLDLPVSFLFENSNLPLISQVSLEAQNQRFENLARELITAAARNFYR
jgi:lipoate-protein ligase B